VRRYEFKWPAEPHPDAGGMPYQKRSFIVRSADVLSDLEFDIETAKAVGAYPHRQIAFRCNVTTTVRKNCYAGEMEQK